MVRGQPVPPRVQVPPERPHPLFDGFVATALALRDGREPVLTHRPDARAAEERVGERSGSAVGG